MSNMFGSGAVKTTHPIKQTKAPATPTPNADTKISEVSSLFSNRTSSHTIDIQYNSHLPLPTKENDANMDIIDRKFSFSYTQEPIKPYRYMFEKIKDTSESMDERIDYIGSLIREAHGIELFGNPTRVCQEAVYAYGLVCSDTSEVRLNEKSIILQTSRDLGMGGRVGLDLTKVDSHTLFPGQVIGIKGTNHHGRSFQVDEIFMVKDYKHVSYNQEYSHPHSHPHLIKIIMKSKKTRHST